ncbi:hypothetical protein CesoFtcFv8_019919 [Champsocephalus esox]|uniref:L1 transposable element RRM domain-containing protein n=2 Tax=Champsocephalus esox TaxID=159716 RepID=A0AAN8GNP1_9TELE|nr:hypothetical protein CesoFtcFv8_019919 [Champsocephalus esox]
MTDHDYNLKVLREACDDSDIEDMEADNSKGHNINWDHTPTKGPNPKKSKVHGETQMAEDSSSTILQAIQVLSGKMDEQTELLKKFEKRIEANTEGAKENKKDISALQKKFDDLLKDNTLLRKSGEEQARYKRRWNLRMNGLPEKEGENTREVVIGILTRVVPLSVEKLRDSVDTVHRLGMKGNAATSNNTPRSIIIQFGMRTVRDEIWKKSKDARVCIEMHIRFKEDFSKEDREARSKLWPLVQEARRKGKRAFLKEGFALIDNKRVDPE